MSLANMQAELKRAGITQRVVARGLQMSENNFSLKLKEKVPMTVDEAKFINSTDLPHVKLDYLLESDGDVPTERERLHHYAEAIGNVLTKDGAKPDPEVDEIVELFHGCAEAYAEREAG